jgi:hypothetical protein
LVPARASCHVCFRSLQPCGHRCPCRRVGHGTAPSSTHSSRGSNGASRRGRWALGALPQLREGALWVDDGAPPLQASGHEAGTLGRDGRGDLPTRTGRVQRLICA